MPSSQSKEGASAAPTISAPVSRGAALASKLIGVQGPLIGLVVLGVVFSFATSAFLSFRNLLNVLDQVTVLGILAIGMTAVIVIGGIDLSVGSVLALAMMIMGWLRDTWDVPIPIGIAIALLAPTGCGR